MCRKPCVSCLWLLVRPSECGEHRQANSLRAGSVRMEVFKLVDGVGIPGFKDTGSLGCVTLFCE